MAAAILAFCQQTGQGVIVRHQGQEVGFTSDDTTTDLAACTIPKATLDQIGYTSSGSTSKAFSVRYTSVKTLVKLAKELDSAYTELADFSAESKRLKQEQPITYPYHARQFLFLELKTTEERATERLALAIEKSTPERVDAACQACGEIGYVFDGF